MGGGGWVGDGEKNDLIKIWVLRLVLSSLQTYQIFTTLSLGYAFFYLQPFLVDLFSSVLLSLPPTLPSFFSFIHQISFA